MDNDYTGTCPRCGSPRWVSVSLDEAWTRVPQCIPCGAIHKHTLGPGWKAEQAAIHARNRAEKAGITGGSDS